MREDDLADEMVRHAMTKQKLREAEAAYERLRGQMGDLLNGQSVADWHEEWCGLRAAQDAAWNDGYEARKKDERRAARDFMNYRTLSPWVES